jgi:hypothetical protein
MLTLSASKLPVMLASIAGVCAVQPPAAGESMEVAVNADASISPPSRVARKTKFPELLEGGTLRIGVY